VTKNLKFWIALGALCWITVACSSLPPAASSSQLSTSHLTATPQPEIEQATFTPTPTGTPTITPTPTATLHPLTIQAMRLGDYPGSDITIEEILTPGDVYHRYLASYQSEGLKIYALLTIPFSEKPPTGWPVIIFNHGYIPPAEYRTTERYVAYVDRIARSGYIVFRPDYRGHGSSEGIARGAYGSPDYVVDVLNAVTSMKNYPDADPNRMGMWGHSMGGYITLRSMVINHDLRAGVIWAGVVGSYPDMVYRWRPTPIPTPDVTVTPGTRWRTGWIQMYGSPEENPDFWASVSANAFLGELSGPLQLHHGTADKTVPLEFSETLYQQTLDAGQTAELYTYPGAGHNITSHFSLAMRRTVQFFDTYVKGF
jgi:uncharacterized protein